MSQYRRFPFHHLRQNSLAKTAIELLEAHTLMNRVPEEEVAALLQASQQHQRYMTLIPQGLLGAVLFVSVEQIRSHYRRPDDEYGG